MDDDGIDNLNDMASDDFKKVKRQSRGGFTKPKTKSLIEKTLWGLAVLSILWMLVMLPFTGPERILTGTQWLGSSLAGIVLFGASALIVRLYLPEV